MRFIRWCQSIHFRSQTTHAHCWTQASRQPRGRLQVERLEDRLAPATHTWTGAVNDQWSTVSNWIGGPPNGDANAVLLFPGNAANFTNRNDLMFLSIQSIVFSGNNSYTISGNAIRLMVGGIRLDNSVMTSTDTINLPIGLAATQTWTVTNVTATLQVGSVSSSLIAGLSKAGAGALTLSGANTYSGTTTLMAGTLTVGNNLALGSGTLMVSGGSLQASTPVTLANPFAVGGSATVGGSYDLTFSFPGTLSATLTVTNTGGTTFAAALSGSGSLVETTTPGVVALSATTANTYSGGTILNSGLLTLLVSGALGTGQLTLNGGTLSTQTSSSPSLSNPFTINGSPRIAGNFTFTGSGMLNPGSTLAINPTGGTTAFQGPIAGMGALLVAGSGIVLLSGANTYTGATKVMGGILQLGAANAIPSGSAVTAAGPGTVDLNNFSDTIGSLAGAGQVTLETGTLTTGADNTSTAFAGNITGGGRLIKTGTGTFTLAGANSFTGGARLATGTLTLSRQPP